MNLVSSVSAYFFSEEPKQFFVGAELCARWFQLFKGDLTPKSVERVISYSQEAQGIFSWILAGRALSSLDNRVTSLKWDAETTVAVSETVAQSAACANIVINKLFEFKDSADPKLVVIGFAADTLVDVIELKNVGMPLTSMSYIIAIAKTVSSIFLTAVSMGIYFGATLPRISLVLETTVFMTKLIHFTLKKPSDSSN